ncbi:MULTISPECIES: carbon-nitrogen family hydrolase [Priestia]|uniref:carbon-nitrogen family hydrolase n=1 Tax=Priestia TaxID=2800373 RepID=UPI0012B85AA1|nr:MULTISPECIES: carbon-nitrogen family hydrolase [Priestia]MED4012015.1 carbon-nitrogen family hydrolase [Priestia aryabhattai]
MKIALIQLDVQIGEPDWNYQHVKTLMSKAMKEKPHIIVLPEMWNTGYALERAQELGDRNGVLTKELLSSFAKEHNVTVVGGSILNCRSHRQEVTNTMLVFNGQGEQVLEYDKIHLFRLMDEDKFLKAGNRFGLFSYQDIKIGTMICYDLRFPQLSRKLVNDGAQMLINVAQWPTARVDHWRSLLIARAIENQCFVIAVNRCGESEGTPFPGNSMVIDPLGEILLEGSQEEDIYIIEVDLEKVKNVREHIPVITDQRLDLY